MKASLFVLVASIVLSSSTFASQTENEVQIKMNLREGYGVIVNRIQQYDNLMPVIVTEPGQPIPNRTVTIIDFIGYACGKLEAKNFQVVVQQEESAQLVQVSLVRPFVDCRAVPRPQKLSISTTEILGDKPIVVLNPIEVTRLPDAH